MASERRHPSAGWGIVRSTAAHAAVIPSFPCWDDAEVAATDWQTDLTTRDTKRSTLATIPSEEFTCVVRSVSVSVVVVLQSKRQALCR